MSESTVTVRNTDSGGVAVIPERWLKNPAIIDPKVFVVVETGSKPYVAGMYKSKTADEYTALHSAEVETDEAESDETSPEDED